MRVRLRYGVRGMFLLVIVVCSVLAAYRFGYQRGRLDNPIIPATINANRIYTREYDVSDLVTSDSDAAELIKGLRASAAPNSWDEVGGFATMNSTRSQASLTIDQTFENHVFVVQYLTRVREYVENNGPNRIADVIRTIEDDRRRLYSPSMK